MTISIDFDTEKFGKGSVEVEVPLALLEFFQQSAFFQAEMIGVVAQAIDATNGKKGNDDDSIKNICQSKARFYRSNIDDLAKML